MSQEIGLVPKSRTLTKLTEGQRGLADLVQEARKAQGKDPKKFAYPNLLIRSFKNPCELFNCSAKHFEAYSGEAFKVASVGSLVIFYFCVLNLGGFWFILLPFALALLYSFGIAPRINRLVAWSAHKKEFKAAETEVLALPPEDLLVPYLQGELARVRDAALGAKSPLRTLETAINTRAEEIESATHEIKVELERLHDDTSGMQLLLTQDLAEGARRRTALEQKRERVLDLIARATAYYNLIDSKIQGLSPLMHARRVHDRMAQAISDAEEIVGRADEIMNQAIQSICADSDHLQELAAKAAQETAEHVLRKVRSQDAEFDSAFQAADQILEKSAKLIPEFGETP
ncbi:MAG TPA: hypothetical protein VFQ60_03600 [Patescibacteria group bacterium]|nr:hypothetical protein [Patescibacteria group bacterium]